MNPAFSETQVLLSASLRDYLTREVPSQRIHELERTGNYDHEVWSYLAGAGYLHLPFAPELGGQGGTLTDLGVLLEELARRPVTVPVGETLACALAIAKGSPESAGQIVEAVGRGAMTISPAVLEASDHWNDISLSVVNGSVSGDKRYVDFGALTSHHLVAAGPAGNSSLHLVQSSDPGVFVRPLASISKTPTANVSYAGARGEHVGDADAYQYLLRLCRTLAAVQCLGHSQRALDMTVEYVGVRVQFGRPIGQFQAVQHHIANMATMVIAARFLVYEALWKLDSGLASDEDIAAAKAWASRTATEVPMMAHQLHGGIGVTNDYDLQFLSRKGKERAVSWGTSEECLGVLANQLSPN